MLLKINKLFSGRFYLTLKNNKATWKNMRHSVLRIFIFEINLPIRWIERVTQIGRDPNTHDFKVDWIPYWEKKLAEFFDMEVKAGIQYIFDKRWPNVKIQSKTIF